MSLMARSLRLPTEFSDCDWTSPAKDALVLGRRIQSGCTKPLQRWQPAKRGLWVVGDPIMGSGTRETTMSKSTNQPTHAKPSKKTKIVPAPKPLAKSARPGTKSAAILHLLGQNSGATVKELAAAADWQEHSIRGFISGTLKTKHGLEVTSRIVDGKRRYNVSTTGAGR